MDFAPPSYESSMNKSHWPLIGDYLGKCDLFNTTQVCKAWHNFFTSHLWGYLQFRFSFGQDPAHDDAARFRRVLAYTRLAVRGLSHTLHLVPGRDDHWVNVPANWLRDMLELLPNLQSLIVSRLVSLDHETLIMLGQYGTSNAMTRAPLHMNNMRLLDITSCPNVTAPGLNIMFQSSPNLMYVDLSGIIAARNMSVLLSFQNLSHLKVLRLSNIGFRDEDLVTLASAIGLRLSALDVTSNFLTDQAIDILISKCFVDQPYLGTSQSSRILPRYSRLASPGKSHQRHLEKLNEEFGYRSHLKTRLTETFVSLLNRDQELVEMGLLELLLSNNNLTAKGISKLLSCVKLQRFDAASTPPLSTTRRSSIQRQSMPASFNSIPNTSKITVKNLGQSNLSYLRIPHTCIFTPTFSEDPVHQEPRSLDELMAIRQSRRLQRLAHSTFCVPLNLSKLKVLVLSDVPEVSDSTDLSRFYISLIEECAKEEGLAKLEASLDYTLPPGQNQDMKASAWLKLFPLACIVLELCRYPQSTAFSGGARSPDASWTQGTGALTMDTDSETFWSAGASDFSFFRENQRDFWEKGPSILDKQAIEYPSYSGKARTADKAVNYDLVERLSTFRKKAKCAYEAARARGSSPTHRHGHWSGQISVLRP